MCSYEYISNTAGTYFYIYLLYLLLTSLLKAARSAPYHWRDLFTSNSDFVAHFLCFIWRLLLLSGIAIKIHKLNHNSVYISAFGYMSVYSNEGCLINVFKTEVSSLEIFCIKRRFALFFHQIWCRST